MRNFLCLLVQLAVLLGILAGCGTPEAEAQLSTEPLVDATASYTYVSETDGAKVMAEINARYKEEENTVYMTVNGEEISKAAYLREKDIKIFAYQNNLASIDAAEIYTDAQKAEHKQAVQPPTEESVVESLVLSAVRRQEIERLGIAISDLEALAWFQSNYDLAAQDPAGKAYYDELIAASGMTFEEYGIQTGRLNLGNERLYEALIAAQVQDFSAYMQDLVDQAEVKIIG